jgi:hypothetical protein
LFIFVVVAFTSKSLRTKVPYSNKGTKVPVLMFIFVVVAFTSKSLRTKVPYSNKGKILKYL